MKRILFLVFVFVCSPLISFAYTANDFVITVDTTLPGSASDTFQLPTTGGGYDAVVDWGGGATTSLSGTPGLVSHTYATSGVKTIVITPNTPSGFPQIYFNGQNDDRKILTVEQWGTTEWRSMARAFEGCVYLTITASD